MKRGCKEKNYGAPWHPLGEEIHHNRFLMASVGHPPSKEKEKVAMT